MLESCRSIGKSEGHNEPFKRTIAGAESGFTFINIRNMDGLIGVSEINGGVDMGFTHSGKEVRNEWKGILILFGYFIEASEISAEAEGFIFLEGKDYWSPWEEEVWQINLLRRWTSRKLRRTLSLD